MTIHKRLGIKKTDRLTALAGGGGKTTLMYALAREALAGRERPIVLTSTHIAYPEDDDFVLIDDRDPLTVPGGRPGTLKEAVKAVWDAGRIPVIGQTKEGARGLRSPGPYAFDEAVKMADRAYVEADGAARLPVKYPQIWEPVIPKKTDKVVLVAGLSALDKPFDEICYGAAYAAERIARDLKDGYLPKEAEALAGETGLLAAFKDGSLIKAAGGGRPLIMTEALMALVLAAGYRRFDPTVLLNQADTPKEAERGALVRQHLAALGVNDVTVGSLHQWTA